MSEKELFEARLAKVESKRSAKTDPYPVKFDRTHTVQQLHDQHEKLEPGDEATEIVSVAGRLMSTREAGTSLAFGDLVDATGKIQLFVTDPFVTEFVQLDSGDIIGVTGTILRTKRGELSVRPVQVELLAKALRPLPDKWHGLSDTEVRFRRRYLDLIANPEAKRIAIMRSRVIKAIRDFHDERGFLEVETPILHPIPGGATARPFVTHHNALDTDLYLRIAKELYLKRLIVGGLEKVYEIGRVFRNEGLSFKHNPEFTMLETYWAYADYFDVMDFYEELVGHCARTVLGDELTVTFEGNKVDLSKQWPRKTVLEAVSEATGNETTLETPVEALQKLCADKAIATKPWWKQGHLVEALRDGLVEPSIVGPTILYDYPIEVSPLARTHRHNPGLAERFEVIVAGRELGNAFSELNDPVEQRKRFEAQMADRDKGDDEAAVLDEAYVQALEYGMPPTGGLGVGIDRLVQLLAGVHSIKEVILFPTLRPEHPSDE